MRILQDALVSIAESLDYFVTREKTKEENEERERRSQFEYTKTLKLSILPYNESCIYCGSLSRHIVRGNAVMGCVACVEELLGKR